MNAPYQSINKLPVPTWNHLGVNGSAVPNFPTEQQKKPFALQFDAPTGVIPQKTDISASADEALEDYVSQHQNCGTDICVQCKNNECIYIRGHLTEDNPFLCEKWNIVVEDNCTAHILHVISSESTVSAFSAGLIKVKAKKNAVVHITLAQLTGEATQDWQQLVIEAEENAKVEAVRVLLGSTQSFSAVKTLLKGDNADFSLDTFCQEKSTQYVDINDYIIHCGQNTTSRMYTSGILDDESTRVYRGTIDFQKGCMHSSGQETDDVLLMSPKVHNRTCPLILCGEESVAGEHAATIGRFNDEHLFYLCSRGLTPEQAKQLLIRAKTENVVNKIPDESVRQNILDFAEKRAVTYA